ncbi:hypothetical protein GVN24_16090 [Rhizobium sp. CRIBSB]|nr:hypothetical protein [Rhizobium sp. CRIBSB]
MISELKTKELEKLFTKLQIEERKCSHHVRGFIVEGGRAVLPVHYSHGNKGLHGQNLHKFRKSLHLDNDQFSGLIKCTFSRDELMEVLASKGIR